MFFKLSAALLPLAAGACAPAVPLPPAGTIAPAVAAQAAAPPATPLQIAYLPRALTDPANWRAVNDAQGPAAGGAE